MMLVHGGSCTASLLSWFSYNDMNFTGNVMLLHNKLCFLLKINQYFSLFMSHHVHSLVAVIQYYLQNVSQGTLYSQVKNLQY